MSPEPINQSAADTTDRPATGRVPVPIGLLVLLAILAYWGMRYLDAQAGGFNPQVYGPYPSLAYMDTLQPKSEGDEFLRRGQAVYGRICFQCHQMTGQGAAANNWPPLAGSDWVQAETPARVIRLVLDGIQGPITVKGQSFNGAMPAWRDTLTDEEIAAVLTFVRGNQAWGNSASAVTVEQVKALREQTASRGTMWDPADLLAVPLTE